MNLLFEKLVVLGITIAVVATVVVVGLVVGIGIAENFIQLN